ncbi:MAG: hypothetical protein VKL42_02635, partial [Snowella sp.]|nr:hypothetical protein [Snowella sp.]
MHEILDSELRDPEYAALYLNDALQEGSPEEFLLALRNVIRATENMSQMVDQSQLQTKNFEQVLEKSENLHFSTVYQAISALGLQISFEPSIS